MLARALLKVIKVVFFSQGCLSSRAGGTREMRQVMMRKENVSEDERDERSCECTDVDLKGKEYSPGGLKKCAAQLQRVQLQLFMPVPL